MLVNGIRLVPDPSGALWWPATRTLIVADLHFEKGSAYASRRFGPMLPPYDTRVTLGNLQRLLRAYAPRRLVCLGDSFHDAGGPGRLADDDAAKLRQLASQTEWLWIYGNHDPRLPDWMPGRQAVKLSEAGLIFRHQPGATPIPGEVVGHFHPKASLEVRGKRLTRRCFVTDGDRIVMPAFGAYTGGLDVADPALFGQFKRGFHAWMLGDGAVFPIGSRRLLLRTAR